MRTRWAMRLVAWACAALAVAALAYVFHPRNWTYYTDGIAIRQGAREADVRLVLWETPKPLEHGINALPNNIEPVISADGRMLVFARGKAKANVDLFVAEWDGEAWSDPKPLENVNTPHDELGPELNADRTLLYFYSDRPGGEGAYDLWVSAWHGSYWDTPVNLGPAVNSPFNEYDPAVAAGDDRLFFSSNRPVAEGSAELKRAAWQATLRERVFEKDYDIFVARAVVTAAVPPAAQDAAVPSNAVSAVASAGGEPPPAQPAPAVSAPAVAVLAESPSADLPPAVAAEPVPRVGVVPEFAPAERVAVLNTVADEGQVDFTHRGDFLYFSSDRQDGLGGFDIYRSRVFDGELLEPERVGRPVSTAADDMDPTLWLEGHSLVFSSNRDSESGQEFRLYQTVSREVVAKFENARLALLREWFKANWWLVLLALLSLLVLALLLRYLVRRRAKLSLTASCLLGSLLVHALFLFLLSMWFLTSVIIEATKGPSHVEVNDAALAREKLSLDLREEVTQLKATQSDMPMPRRIERLVLPDIVPAEALQDPNLPQPPVQEFVVDYAPPAESAVPDPEAPAPPAEATLPALELAAQPPAMEMPETRAVVRDEPALEPERRTPVEKLETRYAEATQPREDVRVPEIELAGVKPVDAPDVAVPTPASALSDEPLPEIAFADALPVLEVLEQAAALETRDVRPVEERPRPASEASRALEASKRDVTVAAAEARHVVAPIDLPATQLVAQVAMEVSRAAATPEVDPALAAAVQPATLEALPVAAMLAMEESRSKAPGRVESERVLRQSVAELVRRVTPPVPSRLPAARNMELAMAVPAVPDPLAGTSISRVMEAPALLDLPGSHETIRTELPEVRLGPSIALEDKPIREMTYALRDPVVRERLIEELGGNDETEAAISRALVYLMNTQDADGSWNPGKHGGEHGHEVATTGLALLCFMGHGATHMRDGPYRDTATRAIAWLKGRQRPDGSFEAKDMYDQGIAGIALAEAYALTRDPELEPTVKGIVGYLVKAQHQQSGGWRYQPNEEGDTSVFGWALMALRSADMAGAEVPPEVFANASRWLDRVGGGQHGGLYGYQDRNPKRALVAEGMFCRQLLGRAPLEPLMVSSAEYLNTQLPKADNKDYYFWYYGCLSLYQHQGPIWEAWNERMRAVLLTSQDVKGRDVGSWNPNGDPHGSRMGRVVSTALATLSLEVYYRYLPMYGGLEGKIGQK